ncbi:MAG TPA: hypothetical protein PKA28_03340 [Methylomusa anaerophila]|uniref:DUF2229 domain-containing protein n=1 Tax=Methylomusa anaerophila TaxID=1930071 RepID=A0A348ANN9_9FIRM|nr:hypothetical protein [Methylomusa anaerophila]BBB92687.1 hypothetical protein MAMMFC1_03382 [Methylomusa anaerophila]HML87460.1 hypothetical protein [Methylomusa anaerophila]
MTLTFPHMGTMSVVLNTLLTGLDLATLPPPAITKKTMELGSQYAPETACLPLKITLGNFIEALEQGADTIITCGGVGPCRLGYYAEVQKGILEQLGYRFEMVAVEPSLFHVLQVLHRFVPGKSWRKIYYAFKLAGAKMDIIDRLQNKLNRIRAREKTPGTAAALLLQGVSALAAADSIQEVIRLGEDYDCKLDEVPLAEHKDVIKVGLVGEIYVMQEPIANQDLEAKLGRLGAEVHKNVYLTDYVHTHLLKTRKYREAFNKIIGLATPFLGHYVGGHAIKSIGCTVEMGQQGFDGIVHVFPFTCMPEIIAKNILPQVSAHCSIPVLSLAFDEQSGEAGLVTRLEAFTDLIRRQRSRKH